MRANRNHIDLSTLIAVLLLMVLSLGVVYSASATWMMMKWGTSDRLLGIHAVKVLLGFLSIFVFMQIDYTVYRKISKPLLIAAIGMLVLTLAFGGEANGARRWLHLGGMSFQPSDFAKFALILHLSVMMAAKGEQMRDFKKGFVPGMVWICLTAGLVLLQPNRSTGTIIFLLGLMMLFLGGARPLHIGLTLGSALPLLAAYLVAARYGMQRVMTYLRGINNIDAMGYQLKQGLIGFGSGGLFGLGPGNSRQRDLFLPESYGDFVFSILGEEYGLIGTLFIMGLFVLIMARGLRIARHTPDAYGRFLAAGIALSVTVYALVNAGVTLGILPTTGVPMPFVSYGGTSMLFSCAAIGVLLNISMHTDLYPRMRNASPATPLPAREQVYK